MNRSLVIPVIVLLSPVLFAPQKSANPRVASDSGKLVPLPQTDPAPHGNPATPAKVRLGKMLFFDPRLSGDNQISCATCHVPKEAFADARAVSLGAGGMPLKRNTQSCLNVGFFKSLFWDGRSGSLEEQALEPIESAVEMNQNLQELVS